MLLVLLCVSLCACVNVLSLKRNLKAYELPPAYSGGLPLIGHSYMLLTDTSKLWLRIQDIAKEATSRGGVIHLVFGTQIYYVIADAQDALTVSNACLQKHFAYGFMKPWLGDGLVTAPEETWKRHRKLLNPAFSVPVIHGFLDIFNNQAKKLIGYMEPHVEKEPFNPINYLRNIALETVCHTVFGINEVEDKAITENYMTSVDAILSIAVSRFQTFWQHSDILFNLSESKKKEQLAIENLNIMSDEIMKRKKAALENCTVNDTEYDDKTGIKYKAASDLLLELSENGIMSRKEIREEIDTMIVAGFDTISNQLMFTLLLLGANPTAQDQMFNEILEVVGPNRDVSKEDLNRLAYTNAVIMESLRVLPTVPVLLRYVDRDVKLKNYTMRAGSQCVLCPIVYPHDPTWGPSGDKFLPERWLKDSGLSGKKEFAGFGLGKRGCIGKQYAMVSLKVTLAHFIRQYKLTADLTKVQFAFEFLLKSTSGNLIRIEKRN